MSNQQVGTVFDRVIQEVCEASQVDFEEGGVDQQTLEDMRKGWQKKLSSLGVAQFPWEPPQPPPVQEQVPLPPAPVTVPSNAQPSPPHQQTQHQQQQIQRPQSLPNVTAAVQASTAESSGDVRVKAEPGYGVPTSALASIHSMPPGPSSMQSLAQQRAATALHQRFGPAAANQVHQLQAQSQAALALPTQQRPQGMQLPNPQGQEPKQTPNFQNIPQPQRSAISNAQTDGACDSLKDWKAEVARRKEAAEKANGASDHLIREHVASMGLILEGGGLLAPLDERYNRAKGTKRKIVAHGLVSPTTLAAVSTSNPDSSLPGQYDGADRYDVNMQNDDDEDAINSDLDDPDEMGNDGHEAEDAVGQVMLCTYDKVQRVKNKWKCTLKDGILSSGNKEYVFNKGQGEFEW